MLALDSPRWHELEHARGYASDIPLLLAQLEQQRILTNPQNDQNLWDQLWDRLEHQTTVYEASYATVPHIIRIARLGESIPSADYFLLPAIIEVYRKFGLGDPIPNDIAPTYHQAIQQIPFVINQFAHIHWNAELTRSIAAALAISKGHAHLAHIIIDLRPESIEAYYQWKGWTYHKGFAPDSDTRSLDTGFDTSNSM